MSTENTNGNGIDLNQALKVIFDKEVVSHKPEGLDNVILPLRKIKVITISGAIFEGVISAFVLSQETAIEIYNQNRKSFLKYTGK